MTLAEKSKELDAEAKDAEEKVFLLQKEVAFNDTLFTTLEQVQGVKQTVDAAQEAVIAGNLTEGAKLLQNSGEQLSHLDGCSNTRLTGLLQDKLADLEATLAESAIKQWKALVHTNYDQGHITIMRELEGDAFLLFLKQPTDCRRRISGDGCFCTRWLRFTQSQNYWT